MFPRLVPMPVAAPAFEEIGAGLSHTCARGAGAIYCWGDPSARGDLGGPTLPTLVSGDWASLSVGFDHSCGIDMAGKLMCWGHNDAQQVSPNATSVILPTIVAVGGTALQVSAGTQRTCAVIATTAATVAARTGQIWCWGNDGGVIGTMAPAVPMQVIAGDDWTAVTTGNSLACGLRNGMATCWGSAYRGGLGDGMWSEVVMPTSASRSAPADAIALGRGADGEENACALHGPDLACWGDNRGGQLGAPRTLALAPVIVPSPTGQPWASVVAGLSHTCARDAQGATSCWGADDVGQVSGVAGLGSAQPCTSATCDRSTPTAAPMPMTMNGLVAGNDFTCGRSGTELDCWGTNANGELGNTDGNTHASQRMVAADVSLIGGARAACDFGSNTALECWGSINGIVQRVPGPVPGAGGALTGIYDISFGDHVACAIVQDNRRACWGYNYQDELGTGVTAGPSDPPSAPAVQTDDNYIAISLRSRHACALTQRSTVKCWGSDYSLEAGQANQDPGMLTSIPRDVLGPQSCTRIAASGEFSCALCSGVPSCWGALRAGRLGRDTDATGADATPVPVVVPTGRTWTDLGVGDAHACAVASDGTLACWGLGVRGQLGDGSHGSSVPVGIATPP